MKKYILIAIVAFATWRPISSFAQAMETAYYHSIANQKEDSTPKLSKKDLPTPKRVMDSIVCDSFVFRLVSPKDTFLYGSVQKGPLYRIDNKRRVYGIITYGKGCFHLEHLTYGPQSNSYEDVRFYLVDGHWYCYCTKGGQTSSEKSIRKLFSYFD